MQLFVHHNSRNSPLAAERSRLHGSQSYRDPTRAEDIITTEDGTRRRRSSLTTTLERITTLGTTGSQTCRMQNGVDYVMLLDIGVSLHYTKEIATNPHVNYVGQDWEGYPVVVI